MYTCPDQIDIFVNLANGFSIGPKIKQATRQRAATGSGNNDAHAYIDIANVDAQASVRILCF